MDFQIKLSIIKKDDILLRRKKILEHPSCMYSKLFDYLNNKYDPTL